MKIKLRYVTDKEYTSGSHCLEIVKKMEKEKFAKTGIQNYIPNIGDIVHIECQYGIRRLSTSKKDSKGTIEITNKVLSYNGVVIVKKTNRISVIVDNVQRYVLQVPLFSPMVKVSLASATTLSYPRSRLYYLINLHGKQFNARVKTVLKSNHHAKNSK